MAAPAPLAAKDVIKYLNAVKTIIFALKQADSTMTKEVRKLLKHRTIQDIEVLETMLERVSKSTNKNLQEDFAKHKIASRLDYVARKISETHYHGFAGTQGSPDSFTLFQCLRNKGFWKEKQRVACAGGAVGGLLLFGLPTIYMGFIIADMQDHIKETERDLKFCVEEIESLFDQTNSLMLANCV